MADVAGWSPGRSVFATLGLAGTLLLAACGSGGVTGPPAPNDGGASSEHLTCPQAAARAVSGGPVVDSVSPTTGSVKGGVDVTINGRGFAGTKEVVFGNQEAPDVHVDSGDRIVAVSPALSSATEVAHTEVCVTVVTPAGRSPKSANDRFGYVGTAATPAASSSR
jgi:hypothetical protein